MVAFALASRLWRTWAGAAAVAPHSPSARAAYGAVSHEGKMWLLGGWKPPGYNLCNEVWSFDGESWQHIADAPWKKRAYFPAVSFKGRIWIAGGFEHYPPSNVIGDVWCSPDGKHWDQVNADPPWEDREHHGLVVLNGRMILFGGMLYLKSGPDAEFRAFSDVWASDDGANWIRLTENAPWGPRRGFGYGVLNDRIYLYGGRDSHDHPYSDVWSSTDGQEWADEGTAPWSPRGGISAVFQKKLWVFGGNVGTDIAPSQDAWCSADGRTWSRERDLPFTPRIGVAPTVESKVDGEERLWVIGGVDSRRRCLSDVWTTTDGRKWEEYGG